MSSTLRDRILGRWHGSPLARATIATWLASGSIVVLGVVRAKVNAIALGTSGVGVIGQANYLSTWMGSIATIGLSTGCIRAIAAARARGDKDELRSVAHLAMLLPLAIGIILTVVVLAFAPQAATALMGTPSFWWIAALAAVSVPLNLFGGSIATVLQGEEQISRYARINTITGALNTVVVVVLVLTLHLVGAAIAVLLTSVVAVAVAIFVAPDAVAISFGRPFKLPSGPVRATILKLGVASLVLGVASTTGDLLVRARLVKLLGITAVGQYTPVFTISNQYLVVFIGAIGVYMFPTLTRLLESGDRADAEKELDSGLRMMLFVFTPGILFLILAAPLAVRVLYTAQFGPAVPVLRIQLIGDILKVCAYSLGAVLLPLHLTRWWAGIGLATVTLNLGLAWALVPILGLPAVGIAYTLSWVLNLGVTLWVLLRNDRGWLSGRSAVLAAAGALSVTGVAVLSMAVPGLLGLGIGAIVLAVWVWRSLTTVSAWLAGGAHT